MYEVTQIGHDHSASDSYQCCKSVTNKQEYEIGNTEDTKNEHNTLTDTTIRTLNSADSVQRSDGSSATKEEMKSNETSSRDIKQSLAAIIESDKLDTKMRKYSQLKSNVNSEEETELVRSRNVRQIQLS